MHMHIYRYTHKSFSSHVRRATINDEQYRMLKKVIILARENQKQNDAIHYTHTYTYYTYRTHKRTRTCNYTAAELCAHMQPV